MPGGGGTELKHVLHNPEDKTVAVGEEGGEREEVTFDKIDGAAPLATDQYRANSNAKSTNSGPCT